MSDKHGIVQNEPPLNIAVKASKVKMAVGDLWSKGLRPWLRDVLEKMSSHPVVGGVAPASGAMAGLFGSLYANEIKGAFPFYWVHSYGPLVPQAVVFWTFLLIFCALYGAIVWGQNRSNARQFAQAQTLNDQAQELAEAIRTLPPKRFLVWFVELYEGAANIAHDALSNLHEYEISSDEIEEAVRVVLDALSTLAYLYDVDESASDVYAANILLYRDAANLTDSEFISLKNRLRFVDKKLGKEGYLGFLELKREFSTATSSQGSEIDSSVSEIALAVPEQCWIDIDDGRKKLSKALPGAPYAFCLNRAEAFLDTGTIAEWCSNEGDFPPSVIDELRQYFSPNGDGAEIKSFVSFPIPTYNHCSCEVNNPNGGTVGVVNIHRDRPGMLRDKGLELFIPLTSPFCQLLSQLIHRWHELMLEKAEQAKIVPKV